MYHQDEEMIARAVAGAQDNIILSQREMDDDTSKAKDNETTEISHSEMGMIKDWSEMNAKEKKKFRQRRRKKIKKYIASGRLPPNFDDLSKEEKDILYAEARKEVSQENNMKQSLAPTKDDQEDDKDDDLPDIDINKNDIGIADSITGTNPNDETKQSETKQSDAKQTETTKDEN